MINGKINRWTINQDTKDAFLKRDVRWGFGELGLVTFMRTYSWERALLPELYGENATGQETWLDCCVRVVEGTFTALRAHTVALGKPWDEDKAQCSAYSMLERMFTFKWLPPGRGLRMMGVPFVFERSGAPLQNCAFISTQDIAHDLSRPFVWAFEMLMMGTGVGFDARGAGTVTITPPTSKGVHVVADSREGWAQAIRRVLDAHTGKATLPVTWDVSQVRPAGAIIGSFGGKASGPAPLVTALERLERLCGEYVGKPIDSAFIVDAMNIIAACVVSGGIRRSAQIAFGSPDDHKFSALKQDQEKLYAWRWASNNSIFAEEGMDYSHHAALSATNGEPGYAWLSKMRSHGRLADPADHRDEAVMGGNPCQPASALLLTPNGLRTMGELGVGDTIWSEDGWVRITAKWSTGVKPVAKYHTTAGFFLGTANHRIIQRGEKVEVQDAETIDRLAGPRGMVAPERDLDAVMDGWMIGDGTRAPARCLDAVCLVVGECDGEIHESELAGHIRHRHANGGNMWAVETSIQRAELVPLPEREIPERFMFAEPHIVASFLRGLYSANGSVVAQGKRVTLKATSFTLIRQAQAMLSSLGIASYYTTNRAKKIMWENGEYTSRQSYDLNITADRTRFAELIGFVHTYKQDAIDLTPTTHSKSTFEIREIEELGEEEVWDITVSGPSHTYWTAGLNVSNCLEQSLEHQELCNLVETFPAHHACAADYLRTLKVAYLYAKAVTLFGVHDPGSDEVMSRNRRVGCSVSGVVQAQAKFGHVQLMKLLDRAYHYVQRLDEVYSAWLQIPTSIKTTSVKPSGTVSLLAGATPGCHWDHSAQYIRRVRIAETSPLLPALRKAGYPIEACRYAAATMVVEFPVNTGTTRGKAAVPVREKLQLAADLQHWWADNQVSCTADFSAEEADQIAPLLDEYQHKLKGISFLRRDDHGYAQAPYETIDAGEYARRAAAIRPIDLSGLHTHEAEDLYCSGAACEVKF